MATKKRTAGLRRWGVNKSLLQINDIYTKQKKLQDNGKKMMIPWDDLQKIVEHVIPKRTIQNEKDIHNVLYLLITLFDGRIKPSHNYLFDTCSKREKEARAKNDNYKADLYKSMAIFFIQALQEQEEYDGNHSKIYKGPKRVSKDEISTLITAAIEHNEILEIEDELSDLKPLEEAEEEFVTEFKEELRVSVLN